MRWKLGGSLHNRRYLLLLLLFYIFFCAFREASTRRARSTSNVRREGREENIFFIFSRPSRRARLVFASARLKRNVKKKQSNTCSARKKGK